MNRVKYHYHHKLTFVVLNNVLKLEAVTPFYFKISLEMLVIIASFLCYIAGMKILTHKRRGCFDTLDTLLRADKQCVFVKYVYWASHLQ